MADPHQNRKQLFKRSTRLAIISVKFRVVVITKMADWQKIEGGIAAPKGFRAAGIAAGLKSSGMPDLALILSETEAIAAGVFTTTQVRAACVDYCRKHLQAKASARAILCNAGQANAGTGKQGWQDAQQSAELLGNEVKYLSLKLFFLLPQE